MSDAPKPAEKKTTRRNFIRNSSLLAAGAAVAGNVASLSVAQAAHAYGSDTIKIGLIGCGGRGTGAAGQAMNTQGGQVKLVAMADAFEDRLQASLRGLSSSKPQQVDVPKDRQFVGFDGYKGVLESDIDMVLLATPPGFRPQHFEAAVTAGKHIFAEKPVAVDAPGVNRFLKANEEALQKQLAVAIGLQRHHEKAYQETIKRLQEGAIGDIVCTRVYWNGSGVWVNPKQPGQTELEHQMRNWYYFNWLCGDHIVEQHIHNLDVSNWLVGAYPVEANGMGGREVRVGPQYGEIFDHHCVEFTYANGVKMFSQCRHQPGTWSSVSEFAHGTNGHADISGAKIYKPGGEMAWSYGRGGGGGHQEEHHDLFRELREGRIPNEGEFGAMSTMTAILGRMATYSGNKVAMDEALEKGKDLADEDNLTSFKDNPPVQPDKDGGYEGSVPTPGKYSPLA
ncbi:MAG: Gfo/Idh/MocA family oxidoreductase [Planctomycetes bacterium]|nr:Gfo/Idh/MocA family oxidoreductase [Planctomycetota bacterium]